MTEVDEHPETFDHQLKRAEVLLKLSGREVLMYYLLFDEQKDLSTLVSKIKNALKIPEYLELPIDPDGGILPSLLRKKEEIGEKFAGKTGLILVNGFSEYIEGRKEKNKSDHNYLLYIMARAGHDYDQTASEHPVLNKFLSSKNIKLLVVTPILKNSAEAQRTAQISGRKTGILRVT